MTKKILLTVFIYLMLIGTSYGYNNMYHQIHGEEPITHPLIKALIAVNRSDNETKEEQIYRIACGLKAADVFNKTYTEDFIMDSVRKIEEPTYAYGWRVARRNNQAYIIGYWLVKDSASGLSAVKDMALLYQNPDNENHFLIGWLYEINIVTESVHDLKDNLKLQQVWDLPKDLTSKYYSTYEGMRKLTPEEEKDFLNENETGERSDGLFINIIAITGVILCSIAWWGWIIIILIILGLLSDM